MPFTSFKPRVYSLEWVHQCCWGVLQFLSYWWWVISNPTKRQKPTVLVSFLNPLLPHLWYTKISPEHVHPWQCWFWTFSEFICRTLHWYVGKCTREYVATCCIYSTSTIGPVYLESCEKGSLNTATLSLHTVLWGPTQIIHPVLTMSAGQPALKCLDGPCVTFVHLLPWASAHELSSESRWVEGAVSLTCVLPGRIYCLLRYFLGGGGWVATFRLTSASISMIRVRATRTPWCDLWQMSDECSPTCRSKHSQNPPGACVDHEASHPGRHSQGIRGLRDNRWIIYFKWTHKVSFCAPCRLNLGASNE